jgi:putative heme-binding domain-containing protein
MGYETWLVRTKKGDVFAGLKTTDTPEQVTIKDSQGKYHDVDVTEVDRKVVQKVSLMPEGLAGTMTMRELVDLVEYLTTLRNKA